ncbi:spike base protein, RCAP_Rcc01079 family [Erythrobacter crassostreae]|uniref:Uncharacterized protein n=1 Tax=Erythrobacter crassostreae TaxID=2828328 RepID=A0A9X1F3R4_9SPHN|nr:hypothetical protein [Erythrobacter crassostrea]MBV7258275.1 hypothetical protein [Erythrobacter crassostrea]
MSDEFATLAQSPLTPSEHAFAVTPDDVVALPTIPKYLYVGTGGSIALRTKDASADVSFLNVPDGGYLYVRAEFVRASGTTATDIVACA